MANRNPMNFFDAQDAARGRSRRLIALFAAAVAAIIVALYAAVQLIFRFSLGGWPPFHPGLFGAIAGATLVVVGGASLKRTIELRNGSITVPFLLGGRPLFHEKASPAERRLLNIVEEMALASGTPVPDVFVLDQEPGINAFVAGYSIHDATVTVTRGAVDQLTRDELQGVIAHEFSHILNGDMRLNIQLIGWLHGLLLLAIIGRELLRSAGRSGGRNRKGGGLQLALLGLALMVVGHIGVFFGRLIKAAVSRQREFLADAAAVQFTRNPEGIAGALRKVAGAPVVGGVSGSRMLSPKAEEMSHVFFADGIGAWSLAGLLSTHPPLEERIRRVQPAWAGPALGQPATPARPAASPGAAAAGRATAPAAGPTGAGAVPGLPGVPGGAGLLAAAAVVQSLGTPTAAHLDRAGRLLATLAEPLREAARDPAGAQALLCALLLSPDPAVAARQAEAITELGDPELLAHAERLAPLAAAQPPASRLPLLDLALPALRRLDSAQANRLRAVAQRLVHAEQHTDLFEFALLQILARQLAGTPAGAAAPAVHSLAPLREEVNLLLSALVHSGAGAPGATPAETAFAAAARRLPASAGPWKLRAAANLHDAAALSAALGALAAADLGVRRRFLEACAHAVFHDGRGARRRGRAVPRHSRGAGRPRPARAAGSGARRQTAGVTAGGGSRRSRSHGRRWRPRALLACGRPHRRDTAAPAVFSARRGGARGRSGESGSHLAQWIAGNPPGMRQARRRGDCRPPVLR